MIEDFSSGYYRARMKIRSYEAGPVIEKGLYDFINRELLDTNSVIVRVGLDSSEPFEVGAEGAIPRDVLAVPESLIQDEGMNNVFVRKAGYCYGRC